MRTEPLYPGASHFEPVVPTSRLRVIVGDKISQFSQNKLRDFIEPRISNELTIEKVDNLSAAPWARTICIGRKPAEAVLGRKVYPMSTRRGYGWVDQGPGVGWGDVFWTPDQDWALKNRFIGKYMREDLEYALTAATDPPPIGMTYKIIETMRDSIAACEALTNCKWAAYDCETGGLMFSDYFEVCMLAATTDLLESYVWGRAALLDPSIRALLIDWLQNPKALKVGHNLKFDMLAPKAAWGCQVRGFHSDTLLKRKLIQADAIAGLEQCSELVGMGGYKQQFGEILALARSSIRRERTRSTRGIQNTFSFAAHPALDAAVRRRDLKADAFAYAMVPEQDMRVYCVRDAFCTALLEHKMATELALHEGPQHIWDSVVKGATSALERIETWGIQIDRDALLRFRYYVEEKRLAIAVKLKECGLDDPGSPQKVVKFLFEDLGLPPSTRSAKTGEPSTDKDVLLTLVKDHGSAEAELLLEYRRLAKLAQAYGEKLHLYIREGDRIHPDLKLDGTRTGRLSCANPGLHQIPRSDSEEGKMIKNCFVAPEGHSLIQLDFSQLELRVAALLSGDTVMKEMFESGADFHLATAKLIAPLMWGIEPDQVEPKHRTIAKAFNFGLIYGMTTYGMAKRLQCSVEEAEKLKNTILGQWPGLAEWIDAQEFLVQSEGVTYTWWAGKRARRRPLFNIASNKHKDRKTARNGAINTPIQGTASEFCLASLVRLVHEIVTGDLPAKVVMSVHDSIILETADENVPAVTKRARDIMEGWPSEGVPITVDCEVGHRWGSLESYKVG